MFTEFWGTLYMRTAYIQKDHAKLGLCVCETV
jgi:hypothetical protein